MDECEFFDFIELNPELQFEILKWRNDKSVRENMFRDNIISIEEHRYFLSSLVDNERKRYFLVRKNRENIGVVYLNDINSTKHADGGLYANPAFIGKNVGDDLMSVLLYLSKKRYMLEKLLLSVKKNNLRAIKLYKKFGFVIEEDKEAYYIMSKNLRKTI